MRSAIWVTIIVIFAATGICVSNYLAVVTDAMHGPLPDRGTGAPAVADPISREGPQEHQSANEAAPSPMKKQEDHSYIESLLSKLAIDKVTEGDTVSLAGPGVETQRYVHDALVKLTTESKDGRSEVVQVLLAVLEDRRAKEEDFVTHKWTLAVNVLGEIRALEAIPVLAKNLGERGGALEMTRGKRPVAIALVSIGEPAVPSLIEALAHKNETIRKEAANALSHIGRPARAKLEEALLNGDAETKGGAALALAWIGGERSRSAIQRAIDRESDQGTLKKLNDAMKEMRRYWGE